MSNTFKGTPGEWSNDCGGDNHSIDIILENNTTISIDRQCRYTGKYVAERDEMIANAQLISFAPDMLEALSHCVEVLKQMPVASEYVETVGNMCINYEDLITRATTI